MCSVHPALDSLLATLRERGFAFVPAASTQALLRLPPTDAAEFAGRWRDMPLDTYMADQGRYRRRRYAVINAETLADAEFERHQPHYQSLSYNRLNGGIERWFAPIDTETLASQSFRAVLDLALRVFGHLRPGARWHIEAHQFRIEAAPEQAGLPTPEGVHRDGVDYVLVMMVDRHNIESGTTTIHAADGRELDAFTLTAPFDLALVDDARCLHGVTPVRPRDSGQPAWRDVLVLTFRQLQTS